MRRKLLFFCLLASIMLLPEVRGQEKLDRGVVAIPSENNGIFVSWRLLTADGDGAEFNIYRSNEDETAVKLNESLITHGTNFVDKTADLSKSNAYTVEAVIKGQNALKSASGISAQSAVAAAQANPYYTVNLRNGPEIHFCWVGDLDGDGAMDYVVDRLDWGVGCKIEAYKSNGTFLWDVDYGPNSANMNNISPGSAAIDVGHWDGVTVADVNGDGRAEVITKMANGVRLGNGEVWTNSDNNRQWLVVLDGRTGARLRYVAMPTDYSSVGPLAIQLGVGNGNNIFMHAKNRNSNGSFNIVNACYTMNSSSLTQKWKVTGGYAEGHQIRIVDVNGDGVDDMANIGYVLNGVNGNTLYQLSGVVHGDRFHIGKFDPNRSGLQGYGVQQDNPSGLLEYYYDAGNGQILWTHYGSVSDVGRGNAADIDPRYLGYEVWSFHGLHNARTNTKITDNRPWPNFRLWWDGDNGSELYDDGKIEAWDYANGSTSRLVTTWNYESATGSNRGAPLFYGDIIGDWREEVILRNSSNNKLVIFTTDIPTSISRPALTQDRYYRNDLTVKGYMQSHHTSYYIGEGGSSSSSSSSSGGTYYRLQNRGTGLYLDGMGRTENGSDVGQWANTTSQNAQWALESAGSYYKLRNRASGLYLDGMGRTTNGDAVGVWSSGSSNNQQWERISTSGYYQFKNRATGLFIDGMGRTTNGDACGQWASTTHVNSQWSLTSISSANNEEETTLNNELVVYPNPVNDLVTITTTVTSFSNIEFSIYNSLGQLVHSEKLLGKEAGFFSYTMDISFLKKGMYILHVAPSNNIIQKAPFIKQ